MQPRRLATLAAVTVAAAALATPAVAASNASTSATDAARVDHRVRAAMASMSLAQKVGQMFFTYAYGDSATTTTAADVAQNQALYGPDVTNGAQLVAKYHLGGVIYFAWSDNLHSPQQIGALSNGLQQAALAQPGAVPLQISTDQEGGVVTRIGAPLAGSPGNMALGATFDPTAAYRVANVSGTELRALGITVDDAPVVDVNTNPRNSADGPRSFGDRTPAVAGLAAAAVAGYQSAGVGAQAKHFPGLGDTTVNTDNGVAVTNETRAQIMATDVPPFRAAIAAGVKSIMAAHIVAPALDPSGLPASLSRPIVTGLLRDTLHYNGVVVTDSLRAAALSTIPPSQVILDAINAGDDELLMPPNLALAERTVLDAVAAGTVSTARIDRSVYRILTMKAQLGLFDDPYTNPRTIAGTVGAPAHLAAVADAAKRSITLLRNGNHTLPWSPAATRHVLVTGWGVTTTQSLSDDLTAKGFTVARVYTGSPSPATIAQAVAAAQRNDVTVVATYNAWGDPAQQNLVAALLGAGRPVAVVSVGGPYDLAYFPGAPTYLAAYGYQPVSVTAVANALTGTTPTGHLPVTVPNTTGGTLLPYGSGTGY